MGRSNTLPIERQDNGYNKNLGRSATTRTVAAEPTRYSNVLDKVPLPHIPFRHGHDHTPASTNGATNFASPPSRPGAINRQNSIQTRYMNMLLDLDTIPRLHNILASFFTWVLLAGFVIFPGTFTSLSSLPISDSNAPSSQVATDILKTVKHIQLLVIAGACSGIGAIGMVWLWWRWRSNFVWLLNRIFLPGCLNSFAGLISTLINVYSQQGGSWSVTAWVTAVVTGACMVVTGLLFGVYNFWILERVKRRHGREMENIGGTEEGLVEKIGRKVNEPGLEPGSVV